MISAAQPLTSRSDVATRLRSAWRPRTRRDPDPRQADLFAARPHISLIPMSKFALPAGGDPG
jgi:hypothetical protein